MILPEQSRMARAALGLSQKRVCKATKTATKTLVNFEAGGGTLTTTIEKFSDFYVGRGVRFTQAGDAYGVEIHRPSGGNSTGKVG